MKKKTLWLAGLTVMVAALATQSCSNDEPDYSLSYPTALVTVKPNVNNTSFSMQLDDSTVLHPVNRKTSPFGTKEVRALVNYTVVDRPTLGKGINVNVNWIDSIRKEKCRNLRRRPGRDCRRLGNDCRRWVSDSEISHSMEPWHYAFRQFGSGSEPCRQLYREVLSQCTEGYERQSR